MHLDELQAKYQGKGFTVVALTNEERGLVDSFVEAQGAKHPIVIEETDSAQTFDIKGFPTAFLVGPNGRILTQNPSEAQIEQALASVRLRPELPKALKVFEPLIKKDKFAEVRAKVVKLLAGTTLSEEDRTAADELVKWIDGLADGSLENGKVLSEKKDWAGAAAAYKDASKAFKGMPQATEADNQLKAILADPAKKDEVTAYEKLMDAKAKQRDKEMKPKEALPLFKAIFSKYPNTKAGKAAQKIIEELQKAAAN